MHRTRSLICTGIVIAILVMLFSGCSSGSAETSSPVFEVVTLGNAGGLDESNLSAYLLTSAGDRRYIALDAGVIRSGIRTALVMGGFADEDIISDNPYSAEESLLRNGIKAYLISHAHLDHIAGLVINSTNDIAKPIIGTDASIDTLRDHVFNWKVWPNFGNEGRTPLLKVYEYVRLLPDTWFHIPETDFRVTAFPLSHSGISSTAFLIENEGTYLLYCGDTGADDLEKSTNLHTVWEYIAPLIQSDILKAMFIEVSFPNEKPDNLLFGHLTPAWLMAELGKLAALTDADRPASALTGLNIVITHIKPSVDKNGDATETIRTQLDAINDLGVNFIFPVQGERLGF